MDRRKKSKCVAERGLIGPRRDEVRPAKGGKEVVKRHLIGNVLDSEAQRPAAALLAVEQIVGSHPGIKEVARFNAVRIVVVILGSGLWEREQRGFSNAVAGG